MFTRLAKFLPDPSPRLPLRQQAESDDSEAWIPRTPESVEDQARPRNDLSIRLSEHWAIVGSTGSGKTYFTMRGLLEYLRLRYPRAKRYILDSTDDPDMDKHIHAPRVVEGDKAPDLLHDPTYTLVWKPRRSQLEEEYARWFRRLNDAREEQIVIIDEVASITGEAEEELEPLLKQMRKHGGTVIIETQEIAKVDTTIFRQMSHFAQFFINAEPYDLARARSYLNMPKEAQRPPRHDYGFFYRRTRGNFAYREYHDMRHFFAQSL